MERLTFNPKQEYLAIDQSHSFAFIASLASCCATIGRLTPKESAEVSSMIAQHFHSPRANVSVLEALQAQNCPGLIKIFAELGEAQVVSALMRFIVVKQLRDLSGEFQNLARLLVEKSSLVFNRTFVVHFGTSPDRSTTFAHFLLDLAESLDEQSEQTLKLIDYLNRFSAPAHMCTPTFADALQSELGFSSVENDVVPTKREIIFRSQVVGILRSITDLLTASLKQMSLNSQAIPDDLLGGLETISADTSHLYALALPNADNTLSFEFKRQRICARMHEITTSFGAFSRELQEWLGEAFRSLSAQTPIVVTDSDKRLLISGLVEHGCNHATAVEAAEKFMAYCTANVISAADVIDAELPKIHKSLQGGALATLRKNAAHWHTGTVQTEEKDRVWNRLQRLSTKLATASALTLALTVLGSCGFKLDPRSRIEDFRPEIPYRSQPVIAPAPTPSSNAAPARDENAGEK